jgi:hypothetical protein
VFFRHGNCFEPPLVADRNADARAPDRKKREASGRARGLEIVDAFYCWQAAVLA